MWLFFLRGGIVAFLGLSHFLRALHLSGELLQFPYQALVGETECLHLVCVVVYSFQCACRRSAIYVVLLVLYPLRIGLTPASILS